MRIAQVVQGLPPDYLGGTETYVAHLARALALRGHEVSVFSRVADAARAEYTVDTVERDGFAVTRLNNTFTRLPDFSYSYLNPEIARRFGDFLDAHRPHVVHVHHLMYLSTSCITEAVQRNIPVVMTCMITGSSVSADAFSSLTCRYVRDKPTLAARNVLLTS